MDIFSLREVSDVLIIRIEDPPSLNDFRTNAFRDSLYDTVSGWPTHRIALDMTKVDFLSSSGVAILVGLKRRVEPSGGKLVIFGIHAVVEDLLRITRLTQFFTFAPNEAKALALLLPASTA